ncbi:3'(2'),5'-bisphosphate nucleotidase CysQ [Leptospira stimsonii]|uniref:3'(2'),5'-bisphosphate nucleotidase CysQ n=1 Tax=Leptospira stimsonii TaxID=2202203 RepID=A0A4R9L0C1_9LEPT|nr:3'(2'),5'-bisphosphate nucleotidase CysQ [Leptospira stimsonii]RHX84978.1 3'(2'),5'-bisphosphate nucleotidase CysQ [Leptospira stimsonii]TGK25311.1 3'(2'),5'-bisphosphate nucleotidase CysQ [Leptospira stimsonii]TGM08730.1 3'(2'),5'-bisphosphate nucleotidase CysQ [Leptospira stimsonii]
MDSIQYLQPAIDSVLQAGKIVLEIYHSDFKVTDKGGNDPVTEADLKAGALIAESLKFTKIPVLSEEDKERKDITELTAAWILDPIDGTREFVHKNPEFAISLGLSVKGKAVLGVILNPITGELICGAESLGVDSIQFSEIPDSYKIDSKRFSKKLHSNSPIKTVLISRTEEREGLFKPGMIPADWKFSAMGSIAYKLGLVAAGIASISISLKPKNEWDVCAGIALVRASGGTDLEIQSGEPYRFQTASGRGEGLIAGHSESLDLLWETSKGYFQSSLRDWT